MLERYNSLARGFLSPGLKMTIGSEIVVILLLILLNGLFSLSELALVSVRRARLAVLERNGGISIMKKEEGKSEG